MSNSQKWVAIILSFVLIMTIFIGCFAYGILSSPAATSKVNIDADIMLSASENGELKLEYIHLNKIEGEFNSKIIDIIILMLQEN